MQIQVQDNAHTVVAALGVIRDCVIWEPLCQGENISKN